MNLNKVFIIGRLTAAPQLRSTQSGQSVVSLGVATNRVWNDKSGVRQEETEYHNVVVWGRQAEVASQFLVKGSIVFIEGRLRTRSWQDKQGQERKTTEVICERLQLGPRPQGSGMGRESGKEDSQEPKEFEEIPTIDVGSDESSFKEELPF